MGYSVDNTIVRVDFFRPGGKWYESVAVKWTGGYDNVDMKEAFIKSLKDTLHGRLSGMTAVCLEPCHRYSHPIMLINWDNRLEQD